ncbi:uncharacterized protein LOC129756773 [Uranotaenia lowii]|uniref:uncharacterized protein LOC129756773 n=1 Tax=Uranotaenia lowii TaxID=190385 RepID=UPI0024788F7C|nr:uncharacterized protein LOC129756773 [Uranotaenia lowii]
MRQIELLVVLAFAMIALLIQPSSSQSEEIHPREGRQLSSNRSPFLAYYHSNFKFVRNRPRPSLGNSIPSGRPTFFSDGPSSSGSGDLGGFSPIRVTRPQHQSSRPQQQTPAFESSDKPPTRSRDFYGCLSNCLTLSHYSPVCGTDHTTYHNVYKLECANRCGARPRVQVRRPGIC